MKHLGQHINNLMNIIGNIWEHNSNSNLPHPQGKKRCQYIHHKILGLYENFSILNNCFLSKYYDKIDNLNFMKNLFKG